jgi:hypothetical protein
MISLELHRRLARAAGATALTAAAVFIFSIFLGPGNVIHGHPDSRTALAYAADHGTAITVLGFMDGMLNTLFVILIVLLIAVAGGNGVLARIAYICAGAAAAIQWTHFGMLYALAELAHRGGADAGVLALFTLGSTMDAADGIVIPIAMACAGWLLLRSGRVPAALAWLTIAAAAVSAPVTVLAGLGGPDFGPVAVITAWIWFIGIGVPLVIKPMWGSQRVGTVSPAV